jgi:hypothetical protein
MAIEAHIGLEGVRLSWEEGGMTKNKTVSIADFARTLLERVGMVVGPLPLGPNARGVRYVKQAEGTYIFLEDPPRALPVRYGEIEYNITTVRSLWVIQMVNCTTQLGKPQEIKLFALAEPLKRMSATVYDFPFCNVYGTEGTICWGGDNPVREERQFSELLEIPDLFWSSGFNGHLERNFVLTVGGEEVTGTEAAFKEMHRTGLPVDPDSLAGVRSFASIVEGSADE